VSGEPNTPELWDEIWSTETSRAEHRLALEREELSIRWRRIGERIRTRFGRFQGLHVIEIGAGAGTNAAAMAKRGASVTLLDYSQLALARAREFFDANELLADFVEANALELPPELAGRFDVSMSFGLNEHFTGRERTQIFRSHLDALRPGGVAIVSVPNARNAPYRASKWVAERSGRWKLGVEVPFTHAELEAICARLGVSDFELFGDSFAYSLQLVNPCAYLRRALGRPDRTRRRPERGTPLDARWSYATVLLMARPAGRPQGAFWSGN
jgi:2-polyprenyl-3-methyl-5-hydroxy-6-metoxy-1,4-benzoquinol methylase